MVKMEEKKVKLVVAVVLAVVLATCLSRAVTLYLFMLASGFHVSCYWHR